MNIPKASQLIPCKDFGACEAHHNQMLSKYCLSWWLYLNTDEIFMVWLPLTVSSVRMDLSRAATRSFQVEERQLTAGCAEDSTSITWSPPEASPKAGCAKDSTSITWSAPEASPKAGCAEDSTRISDLLQRLAPNGKHSNAINYFTF